MLPRSFLTVWSQSGPVPTEGVEPLCLVQSKWSSVRCEYKHRVLDPLSVPKVQSRDDAETQKVGYLLRTYTECWIRSPYRTYSPGTTLKQREWGIYWEHTQSLLVDPGFGQGDLHKFFPRFCRRSKVESGEWSKPILAGVQGLPKGPGSSCVLNSQIYLYAF